MINKAWLLLIAGVLSAEVSAKQEIIVESYFVHERSVVSEQGNLIMSADSHPIYKQVKGLLPRDWSLAFTEQNLAIAPVSWQKGEVWTDVLDVWGRTNHANIMIDGKRKQIVASPEQNKRPPGVVFVYSGNELHQELYNPATRYEEAEAYVFERLNALQGTVHDQVTLHEAQARLFDLMSEVDQSEYNALAMLEAQAAQKIAKQKAEEAKKAEPVVKGPITFYPDNTVSVSLVDDFLKPQLYAILRSDDRINSEDGLVWEASENHRWPNAFELKASSVDAVLSRLLATYGLKIEFTANKIAIISYQERS